MKKLQQIITIFETKRKEMNLSYEELAKMINKDRASVWRWLTNKAVLDANALILLNDALKCDIFALKFDELPVSKPKKASDKKAKEKKQPLPKGKWIDEAGKIDKEKFDEIQTRKSQPKEKESDKCENCTYRETSSGLKIRVAKCDQCKAKK